MLPRHVLDLEAQQLTEFCCPGDEVARVVRVDVHPHKRVIADDHR